MNTESTGILEHLTKSLFWPGYVYRVTPEDVAQLRTLMMGCVSIVREQGQNVSSQTHSLTSKLDQALLHMTQLTKQ